SIALEFLYWQQFFSLCLVAGCGGSGTLKDPQASPAPVNNPSPTPNPSASPTPSGSPGVPHASPLVMIMEENTSFNTAVANMPWLVSQGNAFGHTTNYFSNTSGSLMDYLWVASGSCQSSANCALPSGTHSFGCSGDSCSSPITDDSIWAQM